MAITSVSAEATPCVGLIMRRLSMNDKVKAVQTLPFYVQRSTRLEQYVTSIKIFSEALSERSARTGGKNVFSWLQGRLAI